MKGKVFKITATSVTAFLLVIAIVLTVAIRVLDGAIMGYIIGYRNTMSEGDTAALKASGEALAELIETEGIVLTKNATNSGEAKPVLPLSYQAMSTAGGGSPKVNVFGWSSTSWVPGGSGSGRVTTSNGGLYAETDFLRALSKAGVEFNTDLEQFYLDYIPALNGSGVVTDTNAAGRNSRPNFNKGTNKGSLHSYDFEYSRLIEPELADYDINLRNNTISYSDTAIVVISRVSGESNDLPRVQYKGNATTFASAQVISDATRHYLEISTEEQEMLTFVGANFKNTIVLINSTNTMELGFMDTIEGLDACLIVGGTAINAATAIPKVLFDKVPVDENGNLSPNGTLTDGVSPSGRTVDTYAYDLKTAASWANSGDSNQAASATTSGGGLSDANAPDEYGQNYYAGVTREMNLYPFGTGTGENSTGPSNGNFSEGYRQSSYLGLTYMDYVEGIYVGYKWYETADTEGFWDNASGFWNQNYAGKSYKKPANATGYNAVVQYPFGYGLSYTTFKWEMVGFDYIENEGETSLQIVNEADKEKNMRVIIKVTNTGSKAAKEVVQLYYNPHYIEGGIEKSSANLVAFAKTQIIEPGASANVALTFNVYDLASYDAYDNPKGNNNGFKGYEIDAGEFKLTARPNAHAGSEIGKFDIPSTATLTFNVPQNIRYTYDPLNTKSDRATVENRFTGEAVNAPEADGIPVDGSLESVPVEYIGRANFTLPELKAPRAITAAVAAINTYTAQRAAEWDLRQTSPDPLIGQSGSLKVYDENDTPLAPDSNLTDEQLELWYENTPAADRTRVTSLGFDLADYNNSQWDSVLQQIPLSELTALMKMHAWDDGAFLGEKALDSIGKPRTYTLDGPNQWSSFASLVVGTGFPNSTVIAQTFNTYLAYRMGVQFGNDSNAGVSAGKGKGWLGPGVNIHRSPLGGRNYEYYSEDSLLTGIMCAEAVKGAKNRGVVSYLKHLALYEQESNRDSIYVWVTEQALRETYLKPFRIAILHYADENLGTTGLMTSYGRIGATWTGGSYQLITNVVRNEWGFTGSIMTDYSDHDLFMNQDQALRAGSNVGMHTTFGITSGIDNNTAAVRAAQVKAAKQVTWTFLDAEIAAANYNPTADGERIFGEVDIVPNFNWIGMLVLLYWIVAVLAGGTLIFFAFVKPKLDQKKSGKTETDEIKSSTE